MVASFFPSQFLISQKVSKHKTVKWSQNFRSLSTYSFSFLLGKFQHIPCLVREIKRLSKVFLFLFSPLSTGFLNPSILVILCFKQFHVCLTIESSSNLVCLVCRWSIDFNLRFLLIILSVFRHIHLQGKTTPILKLILMLESSVSKGKL